MTLNPGKPPKKNQGKGAPPVTTEAPHGQENTQKPEGGAKAPLNFKTDEDFVHEWKIYCVTHKVSQIDQFKKMFEFWKEHHGG
ncbi:hypothetical protein QYZ44_26735 [Vibrio parahaemolyticus]|nr:hypothetical protein [Vibrio parahaemolyticus]